MNSPSFLFCFIGGLLSVLSPCILPIIPIIVTGKTDDSKLRPLLIVTGLSTSFVTMGVISTLLGNVISRYVYSIEKISGAIILLFGLLMLLNINLLKRFSFLNNFTYNGAGIFSGFVLGATLGVIWIPCVGPILSSILAMVASSQNISTGIVSLMIYSLGFSIPILLAAYASYFFRSKVGFLKKHGEIIRYISGTILTFFGLYIIIFGLVGTF